MDEADAGKSIPVATLGWVASQALCFCKKFLERLHNSGWQIFFCFLSQQLMARAFNFQQHGLCRDQCQRGFHLIVRTERIAPTMNKQ